MTIDIESATELLKERNYQLYPDVLDRDLSVTNMIIHAIDTVSELAKKIEELEETIINNTTVTQSLSLTGYYIAEMFIINECKYLIDSIKIDIYDKESKELLNDIKKKVYDIYDVLMKNTSDFNISISGKANLIGSYLKTIEIPITYIPNLKVGEE